MSQVFFCFFVCVLTSVSDLYLCICNKLNNSTVQESKVNCGTVSHSLFWDGFHNISYHFAFGLFLSIEYLPWNTPPYSSHQISLPLITDALRVLLHRIKGPVIFHQLY